MVVDHADRLHMGVADHGPDKRKSAFPEVAAERAGLGRTDRKVLEMPGPASGMYCFMISKSPYIMVKRAEFPADHYETLCVVDGGHDFEPVADDPSVAHQPFNIRARKGGDHVPVPVRECFCKVRPALKDGEPRKTGLKSLEREHLEVLPVVMHRHAPFVVVVGDIVRVVSRPVASFNRGKQAGPLQWRGRRER